MCADADAVVSRAAVVIGIDRTGKLAPLRAAASGANEVGDWLCGEGYAVTRLVDGQGAPPVTLKRVAAAIRALVDLGTVETLLVYFAGHGYLNGTAEIWLLSEAPEDPNEAIDQEASADFARMSGIPSVIFVSDCCRSTPQSLGAMLVRGGIIFPNRPYGPVEPEIDRVFATRPGDTAVELPLDPERTRHGGLFTSVLRDIYRRSDPADLQTVSVDGQVRQVVTNRRLKQCLPTRFLEAVRSQRLRISQMPQVRLECGSETFIARATASVLPSDVFRSMKTADASLERAPMGPFEFSGLVPGDTPAAHEMADGLLQDTAGWMNVGSPIDPQGTGLRLADGGIRRMRGIGVDPVMLDPWDERETLVRLDRLGSGDAPAGLVVEFDTGSSALLSIVPDHWIEIVPDDVGIADLAYLPSHQTPGWSQDDQERGEIALARQFAAAAARRGLLGIDRADALGFLDGVLGFGTIDVTLALHAAAALARVGQHRKIDLLVKRLEAQIGFVPFDIRVVAAGGAGAAPPPAWAPIFTQSWSYLAARDVRLPEVLTNAPRHGGLWTSFSPSATPALFAWANREVIS